MVSCITLNSTSRVALASCRNAFTMAANLSLYAVAFIVFSVINGKTYADIQNQYRQIAYVSIFIGCCFVGVFLLATKEPRSMVSCITLNSTSRVALASCRNAFTMAANLSLYAVAFIVFSVINGKTYADIQNQYRQIAYVSIFIGCCFVGVFLLATKEPRSMVSCITLNSTSRVALASCRNAFTMAANLSLYAVAFIVFSVINGKTYADIQNQYRQIAYVSIFIGCCFVGVFLLATKEPRLKMGVHGKAHARISWVYWFKRVLYYQVALVYVLTRLVLNVSQAYLAFYVINDLQTAQSAKALVPAIIYICSFIVSIALQEIAWTGQLLKTYFSAGCILWICCGVVILLLTRHMSYVVHIASVFIGIANALMMLPH